jgi:hypothetical protein
MILIQNMPIPQAEGPANSAANSPAIPLPASRLELSQGIDRYPIFDARQPILGAKPNFSLLSGRNVAIPRRACSLTSNAA